MNLVGYDAMAIGNHEFDTRSPYYASRKSGQSSRYFLPYLPEKYRRAPV